MSYTSNSQDHQQHPDLPDLNLDPGFHREMAASSDQAQGQRTDSYCLPTVAAEFYANSNNVNERFVTAASSWPHPTGLLRSRQMQLQLQLDQDVTSQQQAFDVRSARTGHSSLQLPPFDAAMPTNPTAAAGIRAIQHTESEPLPTLQSMSSNLTSSLQSHTSDSIELHEPLSFNLSTSAQAIPAHSPLDSSSTSSTLANTALYPVSGISADSSRSMSSSTSLTGRSQLSFAARQVLQAPQPQCPIPAPQTTTSSSHISPGFTANSPSETSPADPVQKPRPRRPAGHATQKALKLICQALGPAVYYNTEMTTWSDFVCRNATAIIAFINQHGAEIDVIKKEQNTRVQTLSSSLETFALGVTGHFIKELKKLVDLDDNSLVVIRMKLLQQHKKRRSWRVSKTRGRSGSKSS
eukprot:TRINITY_DN14261_c0_g1_i1.p1 TRINITY_DN14261_c0_g1~~TRINITY_DN14261_c0_g1_i1.p1  ORF type:complete len:409 (+),score=41.27 TRINITY_DN14261_c0_g1_i1:212-1438(+)